MYTFRTMSDMSSSVNSTPSSVIVENAFIGKNGNAQPVDSDLELKLFEYGSPVQIGNTYRLNSQIDNIEVTPRASGMYYFARVDPTQFSSNIIEAHWYASVSGTKFIPYPDVKLVQTTTTGSMVLLPSIIRDYVLRKLGFPSVSVELDESQISQCIEETLQIYNKFVPKICHGNVNLLSKQNVYELPEWGRGIIWVDFVRKEGTPLISDPLFGREYPRGQQLDFDQYVLGISFFKTLLKQTGQDPEWFWDRNNPKYMYVYARNYSNYFVTYKYMKDNRIEDINSSHHQLFMDLVLAKCMIILGNIRSKFGDSIPTPSGDRSLNGADLISRGTEIEREKTEQMKGLEFRVPPLRY